MALQSIDQLGTWLKRGTQALLSADFEERDKHLREFSIEFSWDEVRSATSSFTEQRALGQGAAGTVFSGVLRDGTDVAVKLLETPDGVDGGGFEEEVRLLSRCRHPNLVLLLGFARDTGHSGRGALVYELLPGGDVHARLQRPQDFSWHERLRIAIDSARGLSHLHAHEPEVFHRDIKTANILLDGAGNGKMADFGLACMCPARGRDRCRSVSGLLVDKPAGTPGYADPLYAATRVITEASEVYSFGMVLLELLSRRPPAALSDEGRVIYLTDDLHLRSSGAKKRILSIVDRYAQWPAHLAAGLVTLMLLCVHKDVDRRPGFLEVVSMLHSLADGENLTSRACFAERRLSLERQRSGSFSSFSESEHGLSTPPTPHRQPRVHAAVNPQLVANGVPLVCAQTPQGSANAFVRAVVPGSPYQNCNPNGNMVFDFHKEKPPRYPSGLAPVPEVKPQECEVVADLRPASHLQAQHFRKKRMKKPPSCGGICGIYL